MKLLLDEMLPRAVAVELRRRGHDVDSVAERDDLRMGADALIFAAAQLERRAIVTEDVDFRRLAVDAFMEAEEHRGLVLAPVRLRQRGGVGRLVTALDHLLKSDLDLRGREHWLA